MNHFNKSAMALMMGALLGAGVASADLASDSLPPSSEQLQQAPAGAPERSNLRTVLVESGSDQQALQSIADQLKGELNAQLGEQAGVVIVTAIDTTPPAAATEQHAKNFVTVTPPPERKITLKLGAQQSGGLFGGPFYPVEVQVVDKAGQGIAAERFEYVPKQAAKSIAPMLAFIVVQLQLPGNQAAEKPASIATGGGQDNQSPALPAPELESWIETKDGAQPHIGSEIAFYYRVSQKGYISLYHFGSSGSVNRVYPNARDKANFVEAGKLYRYPAGEDYLTLEGPTGDETVKVIFTVWPSNTSRILESGLKLKSDPIQIIPTHYPVLFADVQATGASRFFALPRHLYAESHIAYPLGEAPAQ